MLTDLHCHLNELSEDELIGVLQRAQAAGVTQLMAIGAGYQFDANAKTLAIAEKYNNITCALGMHPHDARLVTNDVLAQIKQMAQSSRVKAIGEIGLDYHYLHSPKEDQRRVLVDFIRMAHELKKPLVIHDRDCGDELIEILKAENARDLGGMVHCFTGSAELAQKYLDLGFIVSFTGIITFKKSQALRDVVKMVPLDRITVETDSPFLAPEPHRGKKNEPAFTRLVAEQVAAIKGISLEALAKATQENIKRVFGF